MIELQQAQRNMAETERILTSGIQELREAQQTTEEKLHALIDTVDRIIRNQKGN